ncbi:MULTISPECIES: hypothetical protein [Fictibacillus]|uniref:Tumor necrosis factor receptor superfamily member 19 n=1 Tax=Fictibacillus terranigra TaxID=3058424 RepID=A0ABT8E8B0_9BACL|nr:hypothetical protein [Fictibacillus sp. CENA-BCM004]MDN4074139.1 hypothetical protein [Fictibacillus sp. CENA-BCM004]
MAWFLLLLIAAAVMIGFFVYSSKATKTALQEDDSVRLLESENAKNNSSYNGGPM